MEIVPKEFSLSAMTTAELASALERGRVVVLLPVGSVEPHGPHLPLTTDTIISMNAAVHAAEVLREKRIDTRIAPSIPFGVTRCASEFAGAITVSEAGLSNYLREVIDSLIENGIKHVCLVNNHLEPAHDSTLRDLAATYNAAQVSVASPLTRRWARTLSDEFKSGACHAGEYETSIVMASQPAWVRERERVDLPEVDVSLSEKLKAGITDFVEMGLTNSYAGAPAKASAWHGEEMLHRLSEMIVATVFEAISEADA